VERTNRGYGDMAVRVDVALMLGTAVDAVAGAKTVVEGMVVSCGRLGSTIGA